MKVLTKFIEENTGGGELLVNLIVQLLKNSDDDSPKHKFDCFTNIRSYMELYP